jgi:hypothetical protein
VIEIGYASRGANMLLYIKTRATLTFEQPCKNHHIEAHSQLHKWSPRKSPSASEMQKSKTTTPVKYNPRENCFTYQEWKRRGFQVKKGEHGLR